MREGKESARGWGWCVHGRGRVLAYVRRWVRAREGSCAWVRRVLGRWAERYERGGGGGGVRVHAWRWCVLVMGSEAFEYRKVNRTLCARACVSCVSMCVVRLIVIFELRDGGCVGAAGWRARVCVCLCVCVNVRVCV